MHWQLSGTLVVMSDTLLLTSSLLFLPPSLPSSPPSLPPFLSSLPPFLPLPSLPQQYKYAEGSDWERRALYSGYDELMKKQHEVDFEIPEVQYKFGQDVKFEVRATNRGKIHRIRGQILCEAITYTGR